MISIVEFFIFLIVGTTAGFLSGLLGIGGGMIVVPSLLLTFHFLGFPPENRMQIAIGTSLSAMVLTSGASAWAHHKGVNWLLFKELIPGIFVGAILGSMIAHILPTKHLQVVSGVFIFLFGTYFFFTAEVRKLEGTIQPHFFLLGMIGVIIGAISSILGIGGGIITVPLLILFGASLPHAISTSAASGFIISVIGTLSFLILGMQQSGVISLGYIYGPAFVIIGIAAAITAPLGANYAYSTSTGTLKHIFGAYQIIIGILMIVF